MAMINFREERLLVIRAQARAARQFFDNHDMKTGEIETRLCLEKIEFLLSIIDDNGQSAAVKEEP